MPANGSSARSQSRTCELAGPHLEDDAATTVCAGAGFRFGIGNHVDSRAEVIDFEEKTSLGRREERDLIVVGGGVAGLYAALCAAADADVLLLSKGAVFASNSYHAQGGVAAAVGADDEPGAARGGHASAPAAGSAARARCGR